MTEIKNKLKTQKNKKKMFKRGGGGGEFPKNLSIKASYSKAEAKHFLNLVKMHILTFRENLKQNKKDFNIEIDKLIGPLPKNFDKPRNTTYAVPSNAVRSNNLAPPPPRRESLYRPPAPPVYLHPQRTSSMRNEEYGFGNRESNYARIEGNEEGMELDSMKKLIKASNPVYVLPGNTKPPQFMYEPLPNPPKDIVRPPSYLEVDKEGDEEGDDEYLQNNTQGLESFNNMVFSNFPTHPVTSSNTLPLRRTVSTGSYGFTRTSRTPSLRRTGTTGSKKSEYGFNKPPGTNNTESNTENSEENFERRRKGTVRGVEFVHGTAIPSKFLVTRNSFTNRNKGKSKKGKGRFKRATKEPLGDRALGNSEENVNNPLYNSNSEKN